MSAPATGSARFSAYFRRLIVIGFAFCLAALTGGFVFMAALMGRDVLQALSSGNVSDYLFEFVFFSLMAGSIGGLIVAIPVLLVILASEAFELTGIVVQLAVGTALGGLAVWFWETGNQAIASGWAGEQTGAAAGAAGALVYWLVAGRRAGHWLPSKRPHAVD